MPRVCWDVISKYPQHNMSVGREHKYYVHHGTWQIVGSSEVNTTEIETYTDTGVDPMLV